MHDVCVCCAGKPNISQENSANRTRSLVPSYPFPMYDIKFKQKRDLCMIGILQLDGLNRACRAPGPQLECIVKYWPPSSWSCRRSQATLLRLSNPGFLNAFRAMTCLLFPKQTLRIGTMSQEEAPAKQGCIHPAILQRPTVQCFLTKAPKHFQGN